MVSPSRFDVFERRSWNRSVAREELRIRLTEVFAGTPLADAINAVSEGLLGVQMDAVHALESGVPMRFMRWMMDDIESADDRFWKHAFQIGTTLVSAADDPTGEEDRAHEAEKLTRYAALIEESRTALQRLHPNIRQGDPAIKEARDAVSSLSSMSAKLRPRGGG